MIALSALQKSAPMSQTTLSSQVPSDQTMTTWQQLEDTGKLTAQYLYVNATSRLQVVRIENIPELYFERVVFPGQRLFIEAQPDAVLDVYTGAMATAVLDARIACETLEKVWL